MLHPTLRESEHKYIQKWDIKLILYADTLMCVDVLGGVFLHFT